MSIRGFVTLSPLCSHVFENVYGRKYFYKLKDKASRSVYFLRGSAGGRDCLILNDPNELSCLIYIPVFNKLGFWFLSLKGKAGGHRLYQ